MGNVQYLSVEGLKKLQDELQELKTVKRKELTERIEAAKALGDLSENSEYHEAMAALNLIELRIFEVEQTLKNYQLIEETGGRQERVGLGSTVTVKINNREREYMIVGSNEADPIQGKISNESPIGSALMNAGVGDQVEVKLPAGTAVYAVVAIK